MSGAVGSILSNQGALDALQSISNTSMTNNTLENEMSSGLSISSPANNPAGYITAQGFTSQLNGLTQAISNANQGVSLLQTAQGAVQQQIGVVQQLNSIAVQASNGTETSQESSSLQSVVSQLTSQVSSIAGQTQFNDVSLLNGTFQNVQFQVGASEGQTMSLSIADTAATSLGMYQTGGMASTITSGTTAQYEALGTASTTTSALTTTNLTAGTGGELATGTPVAITVGANAAVDVSPTSDLESAANLATQINGTTALTGEGVTATATTTTNLGKVGGSTGSLTLSLASSAGTGAASTPATPVAVTGNSLTSLINNINAQSSTTGITAKDSSGSLVLTQSSGKNIQMSGYASGTGASGLTLTGASLASGADFSVVQGTVQLSAPQGITTTGGATMVGATSELVSAQAGLTASDLSTGTGGAAAGFNISVGGVALGSVSTANTFESAASLASQVNSMDGAKGITASASNVVNLGQLGTGTSNLTLTLAASGSGKAVGTSIQATGTNMTSLIASINNGTTDTGISATTNSQGSLILTQATADNIQVSGYSAAGGAGAGLASVSAASGTGAAANYVSIQGSVQLAGGGEIATTPKTAGTTLNMVSGTSSFTSLADVNVSSVNGTAGTAPGATGADLNTQGGANQAISVVNYALQSLDNTGGDLGSVQQGLTANIDNLDTTSENVTSALGVVQDANLPQVANQLTQVQIQAQAGVAALKSSTTLQQSYLSLLP
ncbi:flagellin [Acidocella sp.]|jgi:flagellin|uniref:flagellin N-terminal helical domain-containing protein n=1 Tax=Acidocella sp. TaxID=50710 RepID=UPI002F3E776E